LDVVPMMIVRKKKVSSSSVTKLAATEYFPGLSSP
jgi:hypothetical protein